ncbi:thioredoxin-like protein [Eremomyces bilateralis CBS 781.70]|uniref:Glutathione S-transferase kappa n=1 Tax=Eremomyces bilateralis CBS 781.70 TaxID=1392243 RepID=A0A6G1GAD6_9PEZI|nr:thioredoxin-like protein [Eremomyces bilateralis CBS 781.70]KAF1814994.1 thioredoxin-like protein [Eremomyces bilateralis CBS 781.70]
MGQSKIKTYLDCVSPYSWFALVYLRENRSALKAHGVDVEFVPVFLGGINVGSGNKPPWTLPAKKNYGPYDSDRAQKYFGVKLITPEFFPILSLLPQRCMVYVKDKYSQDKFEDAFNELWVSMWQQSKDLSKPDVMAESLSRHFSEEDVRKIMAAANTPEYKQKLNDNTKEALDCGAFGCPWSMVTNDKGVTEPFFGSDRFHFMWEYLGIPHQNVRIEERGNGQEKTKL